MTKAVVNYHGGKIWKKSRTLIKKAKADLYDQHRINVLRGGLKNAQDRTNVTTLNADAYGTTTALTIKAIGQDIIRKGDELYIASKVNNSYTKVVVSQSCSATDTTLNITSVDLPPLPSGSYIFFTNSRITRSIGNGLYLSITDLDNAAYQGLGTTEQTLVSADANSYIFPLQIWIEVNGYVSSNESQNRTLYIRYNGGNTTNYLAAISSFNRSARSNSTWIVPLTGTSTHRIQNSSVYGEALEIQASGSFSSTDFTLRIFTQYQLIGY
tara:strand:- start:2091 stop:2897 length:807 start_codon:yes stop_codon:yes gene_type:complete